MHFPTLPKRWRLQAGGGASAEAKKPPKSNTSSSRVTSPRKTNPNPIKLNRSVSFSSDPVFKVPAQPPAVPLFSSGRLSSSRSSSRLPSFEATTTSAASTTESPCPNCQFQRQDWKSQSLMDLQKQQPRSRSNSLVRLAGGGVGPPTTSSARGCDPPNTSLLSSNISCSNNNNNANTATIFSNNLRSNSWRNLSLIGGHSSSAGGQTNHDHSGQPTIPGAHH